jgi:Leucine-rich repeat (LRR) protein
MRIFGIISMLVTVAVASWWVGATWSEPVESDDYDGSLVSGYQNAIDSAQEAVNAIEGNISISSKSVFVYEKISFPDSTEVLDLSGRGLEGSLKAEIGQLSQLRTLDISDNAFTGLPAEIGQLSKLEVLNLSNNPFTGLPQELSKLKSLKVLDLRGTQYSEFDLNIISQNLPDSTVIKTD